MKNLWELFCRMIWLKRINAWFNKSNKYSQMGTQYYTSACKLLDRYNGMWSHMEDSK